jgi:hypothetical protein
LALGSLVATAQAQTTMPAAKTFKVQTPDGVSIAAQTGEGQEAAPNPIGAWYFVRSIPKRLEQTKPFPLCSSGNVLND